MNVGGGKVDNVKRAGILGDGEAEMNIDSAMQEKKSTSWQLCPEFRVPSTKRAQYRSELFAKMDTESKVEVPNMNAVIDKVDDAKRAGILGDGEVEMHIDSSKKKKESTFWQLHPEFRVPSTKLAQYRSKLLAKMDAESKAEVPNVDILEGKVDDTKRAGIFGDGEVEMHIDSSKQKKQSTGSQLTPELRELAQIGAKCLYERPAESVDGVPKHVIHDMISTFGSEKLKQFWREQSNLPSVSERGYTLAVPTTNIALFRRYRSELLSSMKVAESIKLQHKNVGEDNVHKFKGADIFCPRKGEMQIDSTNQKKRSTGSQLTPELRELARIAAFCLHERPSGNIGGVPKHVIHDRITTLGSEKLKELWQKKSNLRSVSGKGYTLAVPIAKMTVFRQYRSELLAMMVHESEVKVQNKNMAEGKVDDVKRAGFFSDGEVEIHIDSTNQKKQPMGPPLTPELRELARLAATCLYERPAGNFGGVPRHIIHDRIISHGSEKLKELWQKKLKTPSFAHQGYNDAVPATNRTLFRQYRSKLLAKMLSEGSVAVDVDYVDEARTVCVDNVDKERTTRIGMSVLQETESVDGEQKGNVNGNGDEEQDISVINDDKAKMRIHSTKENKLNAIDNPFWLAPAAKRVAETGRPRNNMSIDGILHHIKREDEGHLSANPSLSDGSPLTPLSPDLEELARLVAECMSANSNKVCQETLALRVFSSKCQVLKDRWNGMARLSRFQRDGYSMLIPRSMREAFQIHLISSLNNGIKAQSTETSVKKPPPGATPRPQKKPNQLAETATTPELSVTIKYEKAYDLGYEAQCCDTSGDTGLSAADNDEVLEAAEAAARKRHSTALLNEHRSAEEEPSTKRLKIDPGTNVVSSKSIEECKHAIRLFFKWRHRRLDLAQEQFLDESKHAWQVGKNADCARSNLTTHYTVELDKLTELKRGCCANFQVGSSHCLLVESFFELAVVHSKSFFKQVVAAWGSFDCAERSERKERDRYKLFLDSEKAWVQRHVEILSSK